jgi:hypothetical protein
VPEVHADYVLHPPSGSSYPGKEDPNPYIYYPPSELRRLVESEKDPDKLAKIKSALKQWERVYVYPGYPWRLAAKLRRIAHRMLKMAEYPNPPAINLPYYQDAEVPEGFESVMQGLRSQYDNYNRKRFDYNRQGERPLRDIDTGRGDFLSPSEGVFDTSTNGKGTVWPRGQGPSPDIEYPFPPTGGNLGGF